MSPVDFKKCQCRMSLSLIFDMSHVELRKGHVTILFTPLTHVTKPDVVCHILRSAHVALSILGVKGTSDARTIFSAQ